jgi:putative ABC transport system permease protein
MVQRRREIAVRMAVGAQQADVLRLALGHAMRLTLIGIGIGAIGAVLLTRLMSSLLFNVAPTDPLTFVAVIVLLAAVALLASYLPARRATRVDPMLALRSE